MTKDDVKWIVGMIGGAIVGLAGALALFPWIPESVQHWISLVAFLISTVSGKLSRSPLPADPAK